MSFLNIANNASSTLASGITAQATSLSVATGTGAKFPASNFHITIDDEIILVGTRTVDSFSSLTRAREDTQAAAHSQGAAVRLNITAKHISDLNSAVTSHAALTNPHGATDAATASRLVLRDASARAKVAAPSASDDIAIKSTVDDHAALTTGVHGVNSSHIALAPATSHLVRSFTKGWTSGRLLRGAGVNADPTEVPFRGALIRRTSDLSIASGSWVTLDWQSAVYDTDSFWNVSNPERITIPAGVSRVILKAALRWDANSTGGRAAYFQKWNGSAWVPAAGSAVDFATANTPTTRGYAWISTPIVSVAGGDRFSVAVYQNSGGSLLFTHDDGNRSWFAIEVVE